MKEKTFEELIKASEFGIENLKAVYSDEVFELLQQVREATIAECLNCLNAEIEVPALAMQDLPKDRIKVTDK